MFIDMLWGFYYTVQILVLSSLMEMSVYMFFYLCMQYSWNLPGSGQKERQSRAGHLLTSVLLRTQSPARGLWRPVHASHYARSEFCQQSPPYFRMGSSWPFPNPTSLLPPFLTSVLPPLLNMAVLSVVLCSGSGWMWRGEPEVMTTSGKVYSPSRVCRHGTAQMRALAPWN